MSRSGSIPRRRPACPLAAAFLVALGLAVGLGGLPRAARADGTSAAPAPDLVFGEFPLGSDPVVDGDTIRVEPRGKEPSVRILAIDTEEIFHGSRAEAARDRADAYKDFDAYVRRMRMAGKGGRFGTPAGEAARDFAKAFFKGVDSVRLERDEPVTREQDKYGRRLAHVVVVKDGKDVLYAEECVRAGWSAYHVKFGRSKRFDERMKKAQEEARAAKRGIWGDSVSHYDGYAERLAWHEERAKQVDQWDADVKHASPEEAASMARLGVTQEMAKLRERLGKTVTVFGLLDEQEAPGHRLLFVDAPHAPFPVDVPDDSTWRALRRGELERPYCRVTGVLSEESGALRLTLASPRDLVTR